jgi:hypothetical protein
MKRSILIAVVVVVVVIIVAVGGFLACTQFNGNPAPTPTPTVATAEDAGDAAIAYIIANHADTGLTTDLNWTGGRATPEGLVGSETYIYTAGNWNITTTYPVVPNPVFTISVVYTDTVTKVGIQWAGTYTNSTITETSFNYVVP